MCWEKQESLDLNWLKKTKLIPQLIKSSHRAVFFCHNYGWIKLVIVVINYYKPSEKSIDCFISENLIQRVVIGQQIYKSRDMVAARNHNHDINPSFILTMGILLTTPYLISSCQKLDNLTQRLKAHACNWFKNKDSFFNGKLLST